MRQRYLEAFQAHAGRGGCTDEWKTRREQRLHRILESGLPTTKAEAWRYTSLDKVFSDQRAFATPTTTTDNAHRASEDELLFVNGFVRDARLPANVSVKSLWEVPEDALQPFQTSFGLWELSLGLAEGAQHVRVKEGTSANLQISHKLEGEGLESYPVCLIEVGPGAELTLNESWVDSGGNHLTLPTTLLVIHPNAKVNHTKTCLNGAHRANWLGLSEAVVLRDASYRHRFVGVGGSTVRNEIRVRLRDAGAETHVHGVFVPHEGQHWDNHLLIDHESAHTQSDQVVKGLIGRQAQGIFHGKVVVRPEAQKIQANQLNRNLVVHPSGTMNTRPELEIYANDVKCSHGATTGQLDQDALFYLRARGIPEQRARAMLMEGFVDDVLCTLGRDDLRSSVLDALQARFGA